jgi:hypothetical protein
MLDCLANCIRALDPLNLLGKALLTGMGISVPKRWIGAGRPFGGSAYTSPPSIAVHPFGQYSGVGNTVRLFGKGANVVWIGYGLGLAGVEIYCTAECLNNRCAY